MIPIRVEFHLGAAIEFDFRFRFPARFGHFTFRTLCRSLPEVPGERRQDLAIEPPVRQFLPTGEFPLGNERQGCRFDASGIGGTCDGRG